MEMERIIILMSTYNGEKYIKEQLDSILSQKKVAVSLLIRDDGSTDNTLDILNEYASLYEGVFEIIQGNNVGWKRSFMKLIDYAAVNYSSANYFAFSDQDDIWMENKLSVAIECINKKYSCPRLYCSDLFYYKNETNFGLIKNFNLSPSYKNCLIKNLAAGCTIVFNRELLTLLANKNINIDIPHDYWAYMIATLCGEVFIDKAAYILYRQHDSNQIGSKRSFIEIWKRRIVNIKQSYKCHIRENAAKEILRLYGPLLNQDALDAVRKIANYRHSVLNRLSVILDNGYTFGKASNNMWLKIHLIFGTL